MRLLLAVTLLCGLALANVVLGVGLLGTDIDETTLAETLNAMIKKSMAALKPEMQDFLERVKAENGFQDIDLREAAGQIQFANNPAVYSKLRGKHGLPSLEKDQLDEIQYDLDQLAKSWVQDNFYYQHANAGDISTAKVLYCLVYAKQGAEQARALANRYLDRIHLVRMGGKSGKGHMMPLALAHAVQGDKPLFYDAIHPAANAALDQLAEEQGHAASDPKDLLMREANDPVRQRLLVLYVEAYDKYVKETGNLEPVNLPIAVIKHWLAANYRFALANQPSGKKYGEKIARAIKMQGGKAKEVLRAQVGPSAQRHPAPLPSTQASTAADPHRARTGYAIDSTSPVSGGRTSLPDAGPLARANSSRGKAKTAALAPHASFATPVPPNYVHAGPYEAAYRGPPYVHSHYGLQPTAPVPPTADPMNLDLSLGPPSGHAPQAPPSSDAVNLELSLSTGPSSGRSQTAERGKRPMHSEQVYPAADPYGGFHRGPEGWAQYPPWGSDGQQGYGHQHGWAGQQGYGDQYGRGGQDRYPRFGGWR